MHSSIRRIIAVSVFMLICIPMAAALDGAPPMVDMPGGDEGSYQPKSHKRDKQRNARDDRMKKMKEASKEYASKNHAFLDTVIQATNEHKRFTENDLKIWKTQLNESRRGMKFFSDEEISEYYLLTGWYEFYLGGEDSITKALRNATKAYQIDPASGDAYVSQWLFSVLSEKKPKPIITRRRPSRKEPDRDLEVKMSEPRLDIKVDALTERYLEAKKLSGSLVPEEFKGYDYICVLFVPSVAEPEHNKSKSRGKSNRRHPKQDKSVQGEEGGVFGKDESVRSSSSQTVEPGDAMMSPDMADMPDEAGMLEMPGEYSGRSRADSSDVSSALEMIDWMEKSCDCLESTMFLVINTDASSEEALAKLIEERHLTVEFATVKDTSNIPEDLGVLKSLSYPLMFILGSNKQLYYAGRPDGITASLVLQKLEPDCMHYLTKEQTEQARKNMGKFNPKDLVKADGKKADAAAEYDMGPDVGGPDMGVMDPSMGPGMMPPDSVREANSERQKAEKKAEKDEKPKYRELEDEDKMAAENLITRATMYRKSITRLGSSKKCIEDCLNVIKTYPDTIYAEQAKQILRSIPERHLKRAGIKLEDIK